MTSESKSSSVSRPDTNKTANSSDFIITDLSRKQKAELKRQADLLRGKNNNNKNYNNNKQKPKTKTQNIIDMMPKLDVEKQKGNQLAQTRVNSSVVDDLNKELEKHERILSDQSKATKRLETSLGNVVNLAQSASEADRKSIVSSPALQGLAAVIAPECGAARLPTGTQPTALIQNTEVFSANPHTKPNCDGAETVQVIHSPTSGDQFFIVDKKNTEVFTAVDNFIAGVYVANLARQSSIKCPGIVFAEEQGTGKRYYIENKGWASFAYHFAGSGSDFLRLRAEDVAPGTLLHILDAAGNDQVATDQDAATYPNGYPLKTEQTNIYKASFPGVTDSGDRLHVPADVYGFRFTVPLQSVSKEAKFWSVQSCPGYEVETPAPAIAVYSLVGEGDAWNGRRYAIYDELGGSALDKSPKRVIGADMLVQYTGSKLDAAYVACRTFNDTVCIPELGTIEGHLSSGNRSYSASINDEVAPGCRSYYVPELHSTWNDMANNMRNNPWTGSYEKKPFYIWATRANISPQDPAKLVCTMKGSHSFEVTGQNKLFNYSSVAADPMWPMYHSVLVSEYKVTPNHTHWEHIKSIFNSAISKVKKFGETLLSNVDVEKILKSGAEIVVPALLGAMVAI